MRGYTTNCFIDKAKEVHGDFYDFSSVEYNGSKVKVEIKCPIHGAFFIVPAEFIRGKGCPSCGKEKKKRPVYGVGITDLNNVVDTEAYKVWKGILQRCYDAKYQSKEPTYRSCKVCDEWLIFSNFKEWFDKNHKNGMCIDKDILSKRGTPIYSPQTCVFVTREINNFFRFLNNPNLGITFRKRNKKYVASISYCGKKKHIGYYDSQEGATINYKIWKGKELKRLAELSFSKGVIDEKLYNILINYKIDF